MAIAIDGLTKSYAGRPVLRGLSLRAERGSVVCLVGPNGAGKTTVVRILATLTRPDGGTAVVDGRDVLRDPAGARSRIGLAGQQTSVDEYLTARENLELFGRLHKLRPSAVRTRTAELIELFDLAAVADRPVGTYSGGLHRRVDLAVALITSPPILIIDEPTNGLDPRSRRALWELIRERILAGCTVLLTTQYLQEGDELSQHIYVLDHGRAVADGSPEQLKSAIGGERIEVIAEPAYLDAAAAALGRLITAVPDIDRASGTVSIATGGRAGMLTEAVRVLDAAGVAITDVRLRRPTLDDVFFTLTGAPNRVPAVTP